jgi:hypothetical protein
MYLCHFPQISGISSSTKELNTHPYSKYIWPSMLRVGRSVRMQIAPDDGGEGGLSIGGPESGQPPARIGVGDLAAATQA